ncbi:MAG: class I SAM-dependent methyltransferase [Candidatus Pacebacteria bacterium]|nr:class I SAM-dependent methyltransferase [Candidatus Paceibacterota bacterium]
MEKGIGAFDPALWPDRSKGYKELGWVNARGPLEKMVELIAPRGNEIILDVGTGTQAIPKELAPLLPDGSILAFDLSADMLRADGTTSADLFRADAHQIPLAEGSVDVVTARMILHHLEKPDVALEEMCRVLVPGGFMVVSEYVAIDEEIWTFERGVFDIKEPGRHLWTGDQLASLISSTLGVAVELDYAMMPRYSVRDWMGKSGLSPEVQERVLNCYLCAPQTIVKKMGIVYSDGDALVDRSFGFVRAFKQDE